MRKNILTIIVPIRFNRYRGEPSMDSPQLLSGPASSFSLRFLKIVPNLSPAFFISTLLNKAYSHRPNLRFRLYDFLTHA